MEQPTEEQIKRVWEWCGFKALTHNEVWSEISTNRPDDVAKWEYPNGDREWYLPPLDLNNLFKYAVPKLTGVYLERNYSVENSSLWDADVCAGSLWEEARDKDPAIALFWAIWALIE